MKYLRSAVALLLAAFAVDFPAVAHHSFAAEYDADKPVQLAGTVTKVEWTNPHAHFYVDVKDAGGTVTNWNFEVGAPLILRRLGWRSDSLKIGDQITVEGFSAKDGSRMANAKKVTLADGRSVFAGSPSRASQ
jgi:hypothetical protein